MVRKPGNERAILGTPIEEVRIRDELAWGYWVPADCASISPPACRRAADAASQRQSR